MPLLYKKMLAGPGSFSTNKKGGGIREDERCGGRKRERESEPESSKSVEMDSLHVRTVTQCLQLFTRLNSPKHFTSMFPFFFSMFIASHS